MGSVDSQPHVPNNSQMDLDNPQYDSTATDFSGARLFLSLAAAVIFATAVAFIGGELCLSFFKPPRHAVNSKGIILTVTERRGEAQAGAKNATLAFALLGATLACGMGAAGGFVQRSRRASTSASLLGFLVGAVLPLIACSIILPFYNSYKLSNPDEASASLLLPIFLQGAIASTIGAAGGLAFGRGLGTRGFPSHYVFSGIVGALIGATIHQLSGAFLFPEADTTLFISADREARLMSKLMIILGVAVCNGIAARNARQRS